MLASTIYRAGAFALFATVFASTSEADHEARIEFKAEAAEACAYSLSETTEQSRAIVKETGGGLIVELGEVADPSTVRARAVQFSLTLQATCSFEHSLSVRSQNGGLTHETETAANGFTDRIDFYLGVGWAARENSFVTNGALDHALRIDVAGANSGDLELSFSTILGEAPLLAGNFSDIIIIEMGGAI